MEFKPEDIVTGQRFDELSAYIAKMRGFPIKETELIVDFRGQILVVERIDEIGCGHRECDTQCELKGEN